MGMNKLLGVVRAPFLLLVPASLAPAGALAWIELNDFPVGDAALVLLGALSAHIAVNALNEYQDFRSGLDLTTRRTPFSGGSGTLVRHPSFAPATLAVAVIALALTLAVGLHYLRVLGGTVVAPGLAGLALVVTYTRWVNRYPLACLLAPGFGFGILMVNLAYLALTGHHGPGAFAASLVVALLVSNLLLINQLPDIEADHAAGRRHFAITLGAPGVGLVSGVLVFGAYAVMLAAVVGAWLPGWALLGFLGLPFAVRIPWAAARYSPESLPRFVPVMARNVMVTLATPVLLAAGIILGSGAGSSVF